MSISDKINSINKLNIVSDNSVSNFYSQIRNKLSETMAKTWKDDRSYHRKTSPILQCEIWAKNAMDYKYFSEQEKFVFEYFFYQNKFQVAEFCRSIHSDFQTFKPIEKNLINNFMDKTGFFSYQPISG